MTMKDITCAKCKGSGCNCCKGRGYHRVNQKKERCYSCNGTGRTGAKAEWSRPCSACGGKGWKYNYDDGSIIVSL